LSVNADADFPMVESVQLDRLGRGISSDRGGMKCPRGDNKDDFIDVSSG